MRHQNAEMLTTINVSTNSIFLHENPNSDYWSNTFYLYMLASYRRLGSIFALILLLKQSNEFWCEMTGCGQKGNCFIKQIWTISCGGEDIFSTKKKIINQRKDEADSLFGVNVQVSPRNWKSYWRCLASIFDAISAINYYQKSWASFMSVQTAKE